MAWVYLIVAGILEVVWAIGLKYTQGFTKLGPSTWTIAAMVASMWLLAKAAHALPIGTAYAVWTGIGAVGTAILGIFLFGESRDWPRLACLAMVLIGIVGLKFIPSTAEPPGSASPSITD